MNLASKKFIYLGPQGSYTEMALDKFIGSLDLTNTEILNKNSIIKVIESVNSSENFIGVVPLENSIEGIVRETLDNLVRSDLFIIAEEIIPVSHCLISKGNDINKIETVVSHPQALAQCQQYLNKELSPSLNLENASSTAIAVKSLLEFPANFAAIGTEKAAEIYGFNILDKAINDIPDNKTRFVMIDKKIHPPSGNDKTSIAFSTKNETGCLVNVLNIFKDKNISLCYIESRPSKKIFGEYIFFVNFEGHVKDRHVAEALELIKPMINFYRLLGSYPRV